MAFDDQIDALRTQIAAYKDMIENEDQTKNAFIMPFIAALGFNPFNPSEVRPEFTADVGTKSGEKVDYALFNNDALVMIIECKQAGTELSSTHFNQLYRYFGVTSSRIGLLTNGIEYRFFTDQAEPNKMDDSPFFSLNLEEATSSELGVLRQFQKGTFDIDEVVRSSMRLENHIEIKRLMTRQLTDPTDEFIKWLHDEVAPSIQFRQGERERFYPIVRPALREWVEDQIQDRLERAAAKPIEDEQRSEDNQPEPEQESRIETTDFEIECFEVLKSIVAPLLNPERLTMVDRETYCTFQIDGGIFRQVVRVYPNDTARFYNPEFQNVPAYRRNFSDVVKVDRADDLRAYSDQVLTAVRYRLLELGELDGNEDQAQ